MRNLIAFIIKNSAWFVFVFLLIICFYFIFQYNSYQRSVYLNSSNDLVGRVYVISGNIKAYFGLKKSNEELLLKNAELQTRLLNLENYIHKLSTDSLKTSAFVRDSLSQSEYEYIISRVLNNSVARVENFITIDKGSKSGVEREMGVVSQQGIVGIVRAVSDHFAVVQSVLHPKTVLSCKVKDSNAPGSLIWDTKDYRYASLQDFPRYEKFEKGDTIITSGFSGIFPEGIIVGIIEDYKNQKDDNFYTLRIKLSTDFSSLNDVLIVKNKTRNERINLEKEVADGE